MNEEQNKILTEEQQQQLCDDNCDDMHPNTCKLLVKQNRECHYKVITGLLSNKSIKMIGVSYWTKLIDGGHAWIIHPIDCNNRKRSKTTQATIKRCDDHDLLIAHSHVYDKQIEFDMDLIQFVEHGPSFENEFKATEQHLKELKDTIYFDEVRLENRPFVTGELELGQVEELVYSLKWSRDGLPDIVKIRLINIFSEVIFYDDAKDMSPDDDKLNYYRQEWLDWIKHKCSQAKHVLEEERNALDPDQDNTDTIDEIELISGMIDALPEEYEGTLKSCPNLAEIIKTWPPLLLPHPETTLLHYISNGVMPGE